jgi:hypothetical protein
VQSLCSLLTLLALSFAFLGLPRAEALSLCRISILDSRGLPGKTLLTEEIRFVGQQPLIRIAIFRGEAVAVANLAYSLPAGTMVLDILQTQAGELTPIRISRVGQPHADVVTASNTKPLNLALQRDGIHIFCGQR